MEFQYCAQMVHVDTALLRRAIATFRVMIQEALHFTKTVFNQYVKNTFQLDEDIVLVNKLVESSGEQPLENQNKVVISVIHVEQETVKQFYNRNQNSAQGSYAIRNPEQRYNVCLLVSPNFDDYNESLKFLTTSIQFFQIHDVLDATTSSNIPKGLSKLEFELQKGEGYMQMQNLWTALGAKYQPSMIYNMRLITIASDEIQGFTQEINALSNTASPQSQ